ncbi:hypothetical protein Pint_02748 [Pistacia integerrima]|uniref:Uncharacterized protein n=1 Tax=Pistacia integerrima TaxID=434235 RepID=A0ACC0ZK46_9ROSI|nr:hypothetical protein Pint_02748 [Pistacia integerrima]
MLLNSYIGVSVQSIEKGCPYASDSSRAAFDWILENIIRSNVACFNLQFVHVQNPDAQSEGK